MAPGVDVSLDLPRDVDQPTVHAYLIELVDLSVASGGRDPAPVRVGTRYLVTAHAAEHEVAHALLGRLVKAAIDHEDAELSFVTARDPMWSALGVVPQPAFLLQLPIEEPRPWQPAKRVRQRIVRQHPLTTLSGVVLGPEDIPLGRAAVELVGFGRTAVTDSGGHFRFDGVPADLPIRAVRIRARGLDRSLDSSGATESGQPWIIRLESLEA